MKKTTTKQFALGSTVSGNLAVRGHEGQITTSSEWQNDSEQYYGQVYLFPNREAAEQFITDTQSYALQVVEFPGYDD